jgi:endogenous inhibitor of DNA gyrase (YacG/DUF329 family)
VSASKGSGCPICGRPPGRTAPPPAHAPFCSERCRGVDLARWLDGTYRVPGEDLAALDPSEWERLARDAREEGEADPGEGADHA